MADTAEKVAVYTTRPDTFYGVSYLGIAAPHPLAELAAEKILNWLNSSVKRKMPKWPKQTLPLWRKKGWQLAYSRFIH